jgi:hypothetical protein
LARFQSVYPAFQRDGVAVLGVGMFGKRHSARLKLYRERMGITFPLVYDGPPYGHGAWGSPSIAVLGPRGDVIAYRPGGEANWDSPQFRSLLSRIVVAPAAPDPAAVTTTDEAP